MTRMNPGEIASKGSCVTLYQGFGDQRVEREYFESDGTWECPETLNGHWYGIETAEEIAQAAAEFL